MASKNDVPAELRCTYRSKPCANERAQKRNGTFHKLCQEHRLRANENQRNMQQRLRERRRRAESGSSNGVGSEVRSAAPVDSGPRSASASLDEDEDVDEWGLYAIEPLAEPEDLRAEDLEALELFWEKKEALV